MNPRARHLSATTSPPGDPAFWRIALDQSDLFAYRTANEGKGGPFGAQLWLVQPSGKEYVLVGTAEAPEDSNAVVSKGRASAHAEAESLCPEKREQVAAFLRAHRGEGWEIVQVSSGESCPSCRAKQVLFARELIDSGLLAPGRFHVLFKATYEQTREIAGFNDSPYDETFRAIARLGVLKCGDGLFALERMLNADETSRSLIHAGGLVFNPVRSVDNADLPSAARDAFVASGDAPAAVILSPDGGLLGTGVDSRREKGINMPEQTAIVAALHEAAARQRETLKTFEAWDLGGARLYTNIRDIGPLAYAESLWYNLSAIYVATALTSDAIDHQARELPGTGNRELFAQVAEDYNGEGAPIAVSYGGAPGDVSAAHLLWKAKMAAERIRFRQAERLDALGDVRITLTDGSEATLSRIAESSRQSSHYDGKQADGSAR